MSVDYTRRAVEALCEAFEGEHDFAGWLTPVLARVAARAGGTEALLAGRPGSWEAAFLRDLLTATLGPGDEQLPYYIDDIPEVHQ